MLCNNYCYMKTQLVVDERYMKTRLVVDEYPMPYESLSHKREA